MIHLLLRTHSLTTWNNHGLYSSVVEHWSCKPGVLSSILSGGKNFFFSNSNFLKKFTRQPGTLRQRLDLSGEWSKEKNKRTTDKFRADGPISRKSCPGPAVKGGGAPLNELPQIWPVICVEIEVQKASSSSEPRRRGKKRQYPLPWRWPTFDMLIALPCGKATVPMEISSDLLQFEPFGFRCESQMIIARPVWRPGNVVQVEPLSLIGLFSRLLK